MTDTSNVQETEPQAAPETQTQAGEPSAATSPQNVTAPPSEQPVESAAAPTVEAPSPNASADATVGAALNTAAETQPSASSASTTSTESPLNENHKSHGLRLIQAFEGVLKVAEEGGEDIAHFVGHEFEEGKDWVEKTLAKLRAKL